MRTLYPDISPYQTHLFDREPLKNGTTHQIYVEECGNPDGIAVLFLHGGPGSGCRPQHRCYFNPEFYRIILVDQRGCGRSRPLGELENNTTQHLIEDLEYIRHTLNIKQWIIFGGSWGATLALCYAITYPINVAKMVLRGTFLGREQDINWVYKEGGASKLFPEAWQQLHQYSPEPNESLLAHYFALLTDPDESVQLTAAQALNNWEATIVMLRDFHYQADTDQSPGPLAHSRIQLHFALQHCFIDNAPILDNIHKIKHIPTHIFHGRYDVVCPVEQSWQLKQSWPEAKLTILPLAGHAASEPALVDALVTIMDQIAEESFS